MASSLLILLHIRKGKGISTGMYLSQSNKSASSRSKILLQHALELETEGSQAEHKHTQLRDKIHSVVRQYDHNDTYLCHSITCQNELLFPLLLGKLFV